jgi:hypothetical protein
VWAEQATFVINGRVVSARVNSPSHFDAVLALLPAQRTPTDDDLIDTMLSVLHGGEARDGRRPFHLAYLNHKRVARSHDFDELLAVLGGALKVRLEKKTADGGRQTAVGA